MAKKKTENQIGNLIFNYQNSRIWGVKNLFLNWTCNMTLEKSSQKLQLFPKKAFQWELVCERYEFTKLWLFPKKLFNESLYVSVMGSQSCEFFL